MENHAKYGDTIFAHGDDTLYVNLFIPAELHWEEQGLRLRQETRFPEEDTTRLRFDVATPKELTLSVRHPNWATSGINVTINGQPEAVSNTPGSYLTIRRTWQRGDVVEIRLPMAVRIEALPQADQWVAFLYGPIVLAGDLGTAGLETLDLYTRSQVDLVTVPAPEVPVLVCDRSKVLEHVKPVAGKPLTFRTAGIGRPQDVTLQPFYQVHHRRYSVYWECHSEAEWQQICTARAGCGSRPPGT